VAAAGRGESVILVRNETSPEDVHGMMVAQGILTARGGLVSHAAVVARGWGTPAVVGADSVKISGKSFTANGTTVDEGESISLDGSTGEVVLGEMAMAAAEPPAEFDTILGWADEVRTKGRRTLGVRANADTGEDAANARRLGAEGIARGGTRLEHGGPGQVVAVVGRPDRRRQPRPGQPAGCLLAVGRPQKRQMLGQIRRQGRRPAQPG